MEELDLDKVHLGVLYEREWYLRKLQALEVLWFIFIFEIIKLIKTLHIFSELIRLSFLLNLNLTLHKFFQQSIRMLEHGIQVNYNSGPRNVILWIWIYRLKVIESQILLNFINAKFACESWIHFIGGPVINDREN